MKNKQLTVKELINKLQEMPQDLLVFYEGSEWFHPAVSVCTMPLSRTDYRKEGECVCIGQYDEDD